MPEIMSDCDIAITSRGRTGFELAMLGIPTISVAQNEREQRHNFMSEENGFDYLGINPSEEKLEEALDRLVNSGTQYRKNIQKKMLSKNLHNGRKDYLNNQLLYNQME